MKRGYRTSLVLDVYSSRTPFAVPSIILILTLMFRLKAPLVLVLSRSLSSSLPLCLLSSLSHSFPLSLPLYFLLASSLSLSARHFLFHSLTLPLWNGHKFHQIHEISRATRFSSDRKFKFVAFRWSRCQQRFAAQIGHV